MVRKEHLRDRMTACLQEALTWVGTANDSVRPLGTGAASKPAPSRLPFQAGGVFESGQEVNQPLHPKGHGLSHRPPRCRLGGSDVSGGDAIRPGADSAISELSPIGISTLSFVGISGISIPE